jgi:hypothetical protein
VARLVQIFHRQPGLNVRLGTLDETITGADRVGAARWRLASRSSRCSAPNGRLGLKNFDPCTILLNNDLSGRHPGCLERSARAIPAAAAACGLGRSPQEPALCRLRRAWPKSSAKLLGMDPWLINPMYAVMRRGELSGGHRAGMPGKSHVDALADQDPTQVQGIRHQRRSPSSLSRRTTAPTAWAS